MTVKPSKIRFNIVEQNSIDYEQAKKDYINGIRGNRLRNKHQIGRSQYIRLLTRFKDDGVPVPLRRTPINEKQHYNPKNYSRVLGKGNPAFQVVKTIKGKKHTFGNYKTEAEAQIRVNELRQNDWDGLL